MFAVILPLLVVSVMLLPEVELSFPSTRVGCGADCGAGCVVVGVVPVLCVGACAFTVAAKDVPPTIVTIAAPIAR